MSSEKITGPTKLVKNTKYSPVILPDGSWILFDASTNEVIVVSATAGIFFEFCSGELELEAVIQEISKLYPNQNIEDIRSDVFNIAHIFIEHHLLTIQ